MTNPAELRRRMEQADADYLIHFEKEREAAEAFNRHLRLKLAAYDEWHRLRDELAKLEQDNQ